MTMPRIIPVLGDQLSLTLSALAHADPSRDVVVMAEVMAEATYVRHHKKKIAFVFAAMRAFADDLQNQGWTVDYTRLDDPANTHSITAEVQRAITRHTAGGVIVTQANEWRLADQINAWTAAFGVPVDILHDHRFLATTDEFATWAKGRKQLRMEYFYRDMRRKTGLLMQGDQPEGGKWNYDAENRKPASGGLLMPRPLFFDPTPATKDVLTLVATRFADHFGDLEPFRFATTRAQALQALDHFVEHALPYFGDYQDAMLEGEPYLYHSLLSPYLNAGLLAPLEICRAVEAAYYAGHAPLNAVEGYIRQIIGWREYVRGIYWLKMPDYVDQNYLGATRDLPEFYWTGDTKMACMADAIGQTKRHAYAHHIQRLMVTGNFAMLAGVDPRAVHEWYLAVYADAYEWVELPNSLGMSQFADGGVLASKPYASSGNYINKMSNYCAGCTYDVKAKTGPNACPFNPLYWDFLLRNADQLSGNPRLGNVFRTWARMKPETQDAYRATAAQVLDRLDDL
jgi:deoxyribodipyrimidine photolyase-related protein